MEKSYRPYLLFGIGKLFTFTQYRIRAGNAEVYRWIFGWRVMETISLEYATQKVVYPKKISGKLLNFARRPLGLGSIQITDGNGKDVMIWKNLTNVDGVYRELKNWKTDKSTTGSDVSDNSAAVADGPTVIKASYVLPSQLEKIQTAFKFFSPAQKPIYDSKPPKVGEVWRLERTLPSGRNFLLDFNSSFGAEVWRSIKELVGINDYTEFDERPYLQNLDAFTREDARRKIQEWPTYAVAWHPAGKLLATAGEGNLPRIWDARTGDCFTKRPFWHTGSPAEMFCWSLDGALFMSGEDVCDGRNADYLCDILSNFTSYYRYSSNQYGSLRGCFPHSGRVCHLSSTNNFSPWRPNSEHFTFGEYEKHLILRNGRTAKIEKSIDCDVSSRIVDFAWHPKGRFVALSFEDHNIRIVDVDDAVIVADLSVQNLIGWSPDGKMLIARKDRVVDDFRMWDAVSTEEKPMPEEIKKEIWFQRFFKNISADGLRYIENIRENNRWSTNIYSVATGELLATLPEYMTSASWCPTDGRLLATCKESNSRIWRLE